MKKIPIRNYYYLLCYAWDHIEDLDAVETSKLNEMDRVQDLFGKILAEGVFQLLRRGLDRGYQETMEDLPGVRGKLAISEMAKRALRVRGRAACIFEELTHDVHYNRIIRSTLRDLLDLSDLDKDVRAEVRLAFQKLEGVSLIKVNRHAFRMVQLDRNKRRYRFMLSVCELIQESLLVESGKGTSEFRDFRDDYKRMWKLFEDFATEFYRREQDEFRISSQEVIRFHEASAINEADLGKIPVMQADILLDSDDRRIILDTKFYSNPMDGKYGDKLDSSNLYQLLAYIRNREAAKPIGPKHEGVLLYPVVNGPIRVDVRLEGYRVQARGIDLAQEWEGVHRDMLEIVA